MINADYSSINYITVLVSDIYRFKIKKESIVDILSFLLYNNDRKWRYTFDAALEEFEAYYESICWKSIESLKNRLNTAIDNYRLMNQHMKWRSNNG